ncbi:MAG: FecR family protein [Proteobacteria bacterium]|nr:FecR family protein [Pseudomonadota bacterium]MBU4297473.1 FecR family protein [Pseudomonadota bacterium]MCG2749243.1 FecR family protein [Desulfobulbaceae bacterium]
MHRIVSFLLLFVLAAPWPVFAADDFAGSVKNVQGSVSVKRQKMELKAARGMKIYAHDVITTGKDGSVGIILRDNTVFSLGPESELELKEYVFVPDQGSFAVLARMVRGTFVYMSGLIGKLSPDSIKIETPVGTIAIRGTRFAAKIAGN